MRTDQIAALYSDPGPYATAYVDVSEDREDGNRLVELAAREAAEDLLRQGAPDRVADQVRELLEVPTHQPAPVSRLVVATERGVLLDHLTRTRIEQPAVTWGVLPDLGTWLGIADDVTPFVLAVVNHEGGDVTTWRSDPVAPDHTSSVGEAYEHEHKIRGGGWSHLRYQRSAENSWQGNAREVAAEVERQVRGAAPGAGRDPDTPRLVLLTGEVTSVAQVRDALSDGMQAEVIQLEHGTRATDGSDETLEREVADTLVRLSAARKLAAVHELQDRLGREYAVAIGIRDIVDAFVRGQVDTLLIDPYAARDFQVEPAHHPGLTLGALAELPEQVRADLALVAAAATTGADIVVTPARTLGGAPAAALLRWHQPHLGSQV